MRIICSPPNNEIKTLLLKRILRDENKENTHSKE